MLTHGHVVPTPSFDQALPGERIVVQLVLLLNVLFWPVKRLILLPREQCMERFEVVAKQQTSCTQQSRCLTLGQC
jgi:hypothetical protein